MKFLLSIFIVLFLILEIIIWFNIGLINNILHFGDSTGLYFYSALLQANAAILSIVGVFFIFHLQSLSSQINPIRNSLSSYYPNDRVNWHIKLNDFELKTINDKKEFMEEEKKASKKEAIEHYLRNWIEVEEQILFTKEKLKAPTLFFVALIIIDSICLLFSDILNATGSSVELSIFLPVLFSECLSLILVYRNIVWVLDYQKIKKQ